MFLKGTLRVLHKRYLMVFSLMVGLEEDYSLCRFAALIFAAAFMPRSNRACFGLEQGFPLGRLKNSVRPSMAVAY
jgi:hypothetical protein